MSQRAFFKENLKAGADPDIRNIRNIRNIRTGECQILSLEYSIANSRLHKVTTSLYLFEKNITKST